MLFWAIFQSKRLKLMHFTNKVLKQWVGFLEKVDSDGQIKLLAKD
jgi:hypothetical protein